MAINLRDKNFVSAIQDMSLIEHAIKGLIGGDKYYFSSYIKGVNRVYYIEVLEHADGEEFIMYRDFTKYHYSNDFRPTGLIIEDEAIKIFTASANTPGLNPLITSYSATPADAMAGYLQVYLDALQTATTY